MMAELPNDTGMISDTEQIPGSLAAGEASSLEPGAPDPRLQAMRERSAAQSERMTDRLEAGLGKSEDLARRRAEELNPLREEQARAARQPLPSPPQMQALPQPPSPNLPGTKGQDADNDHAWLTAAMFLGSLGGALTRNHVTNALAGFTGAVEGYNQGKKDIFNQQMEVWRANNTKALEENERANKDYQNILAGRKLSMDQKMLQVQIAAQKYDDEAMGNAAAQKDAITVATVADTRMKFADNMRKAGTALDQEHIDTAKREAAGQVDLMAKIAKGEVPMPSVSGRGVYTNAYNAALIEGALKLNPDLTGNTFTVKRAESLIPSRVEAAGRTAGARTAGVAGTNIELAMRSVGPVIEMAGTASQDVPRTEFVHLNKLLQAAETEISDPKLQRFKLVNEELATMFARVLNPRSSVITVSEKNHARDLISTATSPEAYEAMLRQIGQLAEREFKLVKEQQSGAPIAPIAVPPGAHGSSLSEAAGSLGGKAREAVETSIPGAVGRTEPSGVRIGASPPGGKSQAPLQIPEFLRNLPEGWKVRPRHPLHGTPAERETQP